MPKKTSITIALLLTISILLPIFATAAEIGNIKTGDFIRTADYKERKENNQNEIKPIGDPEIKIIFPKRGWLQIFGIAIIPYGKTLVIGSVLNIVEYAANINKLECIIKNVKTSANKDRRPLLRPTIKSAKIKITDNVHKPFVLI